MHNEHVVCSKTHDRSNIKVYTSNTPSSVHCFWSRLRLAEAALFILDEGACTLSHRDGAVTNDIRLESFAGHKDRHPRARDGICLVKVRNGLGKGCARHLSGRSGCNETLQPS